MYCVSILIKIIIDIEDVKKAEVITLNNKCLFVYRLFNDGNPLNYPEYLSNSGLDIYLPNKVSAVAENAKVNSQEQSANATFISQNFIFFF